MVTHHVTITKKKSNKKKSPKQQNILAGMKSNSKTNAINEDSAKKLTNSHKASKNLQSNRTKLTP